MNAKRIAYFITVLLFGILLVACERTKIGDITADPGRFMNKEVAVAGHVTQSIGFLGRGNACHHSRRARRQRSAARTRRKTGEHRR